MSVWLFASLASQAHLMKLGADPTTGTRIWENYLRTNNLPFARISGAADMQRMVAPAVLILPSAVVLSDAERAAIWQWRNRGGAVLSTWLTGTQSATGASLGYDFMRDVLDVEVVGNTQDEVEDTFMMVHGDDPLSNSLDAGTRVWLERVTGQLPLRLRGKHEAAQIMSWSRGYDAQKPAGLISYNERKMPSGMYSRVVTLGYPEQNWLRSDPKQLKAISSDVFAWLFRQPRAYLGAWPFPFQSSLLLAVQAAEPVADGEVTIAKSVSDMGGRATFYVHGGNVTKAAPIVKKIQALGQEIGYFGDSFEGFKGQTSTKQAERMDAMQKQLAEAGVVMPVAASFSTPLDSYDSTTQQLVQTRKFDNYLAFMEVTDSRLPFIAGTSDANPGGVVVLARTLMGPEEALDEDSEAGMDNFLGSLDVSARMGGVSVVRLPSQSLLVPDQRKQLFDKMLALREEVWIASASQIAAWWRNRSQVSVSMAPNAQGYVLTATVARTVTTVEPLTIWVNLPRPGSRLRLQALFKGDKLPDVMAVDSMRSALVWRAPVVGTYRWLLQFEEPSGYAHF